MKKNKYSKITIISILVIIIFSIIGCIYLVKQNKNKVMDNEYQNITDIYDEPTEKKPSIEDEIKENIKSMTLEEKIGQMLIIYYTGPTYTDELKGIIKNVKPGGFILMSDNYSTYDNTLSFIKNMQHDSEIPMIIATDYEGGSVQRLKKITDIKVTNIPYMYYLGKTNDTELCSKVGEIMAKQLRTLGINLDFAPVTDVFSNPNNAIIGKRSFSSDPNIVTSMAKSLIKGMEDNLVNTCIKHFPGHGNTEKDSHVELPIINKTLEELEEIDIKPFKELINISDMIMIGHIALPKITGDNTPASLSKTIITDLLKEKYKFEGLVITDALNMGALKNNYTDTEIYINAINAGVDLLLMPNGARNTVEIIKEAVNNNEIPEEKIDESVFKILMYKHENIKENYLDKSYLNKEEYNEILDKIKTE